MKLRIGTFNAENLFARFRFQGVQETYTKRDGKKGTRYRPYTKTELAQIARDGWMVDETKFDSFKPEERRITADAIKAVHADVLALQEIESMDTLKRFVGAYLSNQKFEQKILIDANDPRFIDVALLVKKGFDVPYLHTHQFERTADHRAFLFSRDCLEVGVQLAPGKILPVFVNHFKSMMEGRDKTMARRQEQVQRVADLLRERFGPNPGGQPWVVLGDFNDYLPSPALDPLLAQPWAVNVVERIPNPSDRWTHYFAGGNEYRQLDFILLSKSLADANPGAVPHIERQGLPKRARNYTGPRFPGVGGNDPKASDHCPVVIEIDV